MILPRPRIGMLSLVTVSPVITAFHSRCLSHHVFWPSKPLIWNHYLLTMLTWNRRDSTPLSAAPRAPKGDQGWIFWSYKSLSGLRTECFVLVFNWNHFEMRLLIRELIFIYCGLFPLILVVFVLFLLSLRFGQISPLARVGVFCSPSRQGHLIDRYFRNDK